MKKLALSSSHKNPSKYIPSLTHTQNKFFECISEALILHSSQPKIPYTKACCISSILYDSLTAYERIMLSYHQCGNYISLDDLYVHLQNSNIEQTHTLFFSTQS